MKIRRAEQDTCYRGHPFPENRYIRPSGQAMCRACRRIRYGTDPVAVDRAVTGDNVPPLAPAERREAIRRLTIHGHSAHQIADRIGCSARTVHRARARIRTT